MLRLSQKDIKQGYRGIKHLAQKEVKRGEYRKAMAHIRHCSSLAGQFNWIYEDDEIETLMQQISAAVICTNKRQNEFHTDRWVLYDDWCTSYVLALQWIEAMAQTGKQILYITSRDLSKKKRSADIIDRIEVFPNVQIKILKKGTEFERAQEIFDSIIDFGAVKVVLHKNPVLSPCNLALYALPEQVKVYLINLSDQTFWIGAKAIDYCLEFRNFGASVSVQRRGLKREQLLMVPFYPADDKNVFEGIPVERKDNQVLIFSGGDYYKTLNEKGTYWKLVKKLLNNYPQLVFLFATKNIPEGDSEIRQFINSNNFENRFIYINFRPDIYQVFAHCDIYMGTCPTSGSLMTGLACVNAKPILQFYEPGTTDDETEQSVCFNEKYDISYSDEVLFMKEADKLITDSGYRKKQGDRLQRAIISQHQFNLLVKETLYSDITQIPIEEIFVDYNELDNRWFYMEKAGYISSSVFIYSTLGKLNCLFFAPGLFIKKNINRIFKLS